MAGLATREFRWPLAAFPRPMLAGRFPLDDRNFSYRYHSPTHALHVYDYFGGMKLAKQVFELKPGDFTITPAGTDSWYDLRKPGHHWCIHFLPGPAAACVGARSLRLPLHGSLGTDSEHLAERVRNLASLLARSNQQPACASLTAAMASVALQDLLLWLALRVTDKASATRRSEQAVEKAAWIIRSRFAQPLSIPLIADEVGLNQNYLASQFRRRFGMTIQRYVLKLRIEHARTLIATTNMPMQMVGRRVGIGDPQYFNKLFRRMTGLSPTSYRVQRAPLIHA